jgi:hypothetical protein
LIENYVRILREVSQLHPLGGRGGKKEQWGGDWSVSRIVVRLFCEIHIRRQLTVLSRIYQLQQGLKGSITGQGNFPEEAHKSCQQILSAIPSLQRLKLFFATASPVVLGLFVASVGGVENAYEAAVKVASPQFRARIATSTQSGLLFGYSLIVAFYLLAFFAGSFAYKRGLFFPGVRYLEASEHNKRRIDRNRELRKVEKTPDGTNVYALESDLFAKLQFAKPKEPFIDILITIGAVLTGVLAWGLYVVTATRSSEVPGIEIFTVLFGIIGGAVIFRAVQIARQRDRKEWR